MNCDMTLHFLENRLDTFKSWPFDNGYACSPMKMAEAGFYMVTLDDEPDLARCFVCLKELDGWEPSDDPLEEHRSHSPNCPFLKLKNRNDITVADLLKMDLATQLNVLRDRVEKSIEKFKEAAQVSGDILASMNK